MIYIENGFLNVKGKNENILLEYYYLTQYISKYIVNDSDFSKFEDTILKDICEELVILLEKRGDKNGV